MTDDTKTLGEEALNKLLTNPPPDAEEGAAAGPPKAKVDLTPEEAAELRSQKKARLTQVLHRGVTNERLQNVLESSVPEGRVGKFIRDTEEDFIRYQNLGYSFNYTEKARGLHGTGDGRIRVGDLVLVTIDREDYELLGEIRTERVKSKLEEGRREYTRQAEAASSQGGPTSFDESSTTIKRGG